MDFSDTQQEFEALAKNFYNLFHIMLSIYDEDRKLICAYPQKLCPFCSLVRTDKALMKQCLLHDEQAFEVCKQTLEPYMYHCHMGLVEVAEPVVKNGVVLGYLLFGQITDDRHKTLIKERINTLQTGPDHAALHARLRDIKYRSPDYVYSMSSILVMSAAYIQMNDIFARQKDSLSYMITKYIHQNMDNHINLQDICTQFGISRSALYSLSKKNYGMGISDYINTIRINSAKLLLRTQEQSINDIAHAVGFQDSNYFTKVFKKYAACTPRDYRMQYQLPVSKATDKITTE